MSLISITSDEFLNPKNIPSIPESILQYRALPKEQLVEGIIEVRDKIAAIKKTTLNKKEVSVKLNEKDILTLANELYAIEQIFEDIKNTIIGESNDTEIREPAVSTKEEGKVSSNRGANKRNLK